MTSRKASEKNGKTSSNTRLREARTDQGWSQQQLADEIGTTPVNISRWENGATFPSPYFRQKLSEVFEKTPAELGLLLPSSDGLRIWSVPFTRNPFFTGREDLLALLHERLSRSKAAALTQPQALSGLGGIGKTQTAAEYAHRHGDDYTHVIWMLADTRETLASDFVALAERLDLPEIAEPDQVVVTAAKRWLANHEGWLLILDNADDLLLTREFLPTRHKGYILYTTRSQATGKMAANIEVEQLSLEEGALLLLRGSGLLEKEARLEAARESDREAALLIATEMGGLPLALVQAAAYIEETGCGLEDYLGLFKTRRKELLARGSPLLLDYSETVATTWSISFERVEQQSPAAAEMLRFCAFLAPDAIPEELLTRGAAELGPVLAADAGDRLKLDTAVEVLRRYSLVRRDRDTHTLTIHRLVQAVVKEHMDEPTRRVWAERTVRAVNAAFPEAKASPGENQQSYLPHTQECATLISQYDLCFPEAADLLHRAGVVLYIQGFYAQSHSFHQQALAIREQMFGDEYLAVADSLNALAVLSHAQDDIEQEEKFHWRALAIRKKALGADDPAIAESLNNLGVIYRSQERYEQAEAFFQQALGIYQQALGSEHPETLMTHINLAKLYMEQGKYEQAERLFKEALATCERTLEPEDPLIAYTLNLLARLSYEQRNYEQAETLWNRSLAILVKTLGQQHPATAERLNDLAELYAAQGRYTQAQSRAQRAVSIAEKTLGPQHPDTIAYRAHLARIVSKREGRQGDDHHPAPAQL